MPLTPDSTEQNSSRSTGDLVYSGLKERILGHELPLGSPLREDEVAGWFAASRVPAREALRKLEQEGLVERLGRSYAVRTFSVEEIVVIYRQRAALEHLAVELAVDRLGHDDADAVLRPLRDLLKQQQIAATPPASRSDFSRLDKAFHMAIASISGQSLLLHELDIILSRVQLIRTAEIKRDSGAESAYKDHCRIFCALERRDAQTAKSELDYHFSTTVRLHRHESRAKSPQDTLNA